MAENVNLPKIIFIEKPCASGPTQLKPILLKNQLFSDRLLCISFQFHVQWHHVGHGGSTYTKEISISKKSIAFSTGELVLLNIYQHTTRLWKILGSHMSISLGNSRNVCGGKLDFLIVRGLGNPDLGS